MKKRGAKKRNFFISGTLILLLIGLRVALPYLILKNLNSYLSTFSPIYEIHIGNLDLSLLKTSYRFENLTAKYKGDNKEFFNIDSAIVSLAWRELLHRRILTDVTINNGKFILTRVLFEKSKSPEVHIKDQAKKVTGTLFPVEVAVVNVHDSYFDFSDFVRKSPADQWRIFKIESEIKNITSTTKDPISEFTFSGTLLRSGQITASGEYKKLDNPIAWQTRLKLQDFQLSSSNAMLIELVPFTFAAGTLQVFSEVKSQNGKIDGYAKPFFRNVKIIQKHQAFKNIKHFAFEILGASSNLLLRSSANRTVATRIAFHEDHGVLKVDKEQALEKAIENGFETPLSASFDHSPKLN